MRKPAFLSNERLSRFLVSILLTMGLLLPLMFTFEAESALALAIASATAVTVLCTALGTLRRGRLVLGIVGGALLAVQLVLPHMGLIGWAMEAFKAVSLYLNGVTEAAPLFARQLGLTLGVTVAGISYLFSSRNVGFLPATILVVLMLFGMWSLCQAEPPWFATPRWWRCFCWFLRPRTKNPTCFRCCRWRWRWWRWPCCCFLPDRR